MRRGPACDLYVVWTLLPGPSRRSFRAALPLDAATWARGRAWTIWKALIGLASCIDSDRCAAAMWRDVIEAVTEDHRL